MSDARRAADWLDVRAAMRHIVEALPVLPAESVALRDSWGRTLAADVSSPIEHPPWDNSAMDGYAVRADDVRAARPDAPVQLRVLERVPAGEFPTQPIRPGTAIRIMTGAPIPEGADTVIRVEHTQDGGDHVLVLDALDTDRNIRFRGEDMQRGTRVLERGRLLRASEVGLLATVCWAQVPVQRRPKVAILSTGDELAELSEFDEVLAGRKIANSNSYALAAAVQATGAEPLVLGIARDNAESLVAHLERARGADALITTAGASVGDHDLVKDVLESLGYQADFWRVRMRPGSPFSFGWWRAGSSAVPVFGLPGNPVSALVTSELLVRPALRRMLGRRDVYPPTLRVRAAEAISSKRGLVHFLRVRLHTSADGTVEATLTGAQGSGLITSMAEAAALLVVPEEQDRVEAGELAWAVRLGAGDDGQDHIGF